jgi:cytoskeletal protein CcmA (bactofilin family)
VKGTGNDDRVGREVLQMFGKDVKTKPAEDVNPSPPEEKRDNRPPGSGTSVLGPDARFDGKLETGSNMQIDGDFKGELNVRGTLMVGKQGKVNATVDAGKVVVHGRLEGKVAASGKIELMEGSSMIGDIDAPSLVIQDNVEFEGTCRTGKKK